MSYHSEEFLELESQSTFIRITTELLTPTYTACSVEISDCRNSCEVKDCAKCKDGFYNRILLSKSGVDQLIKALLKVRGHV